MPGISISKALAREPLILLAHGPPGSSQSCMEELTGTWQSDSTVQGFVRLSYETVQLKALWKT